MSEEKYGFVVGPSGEVIELDPSKASKTTGAGLTELGRYVFRSSIVLGVAIVVAAVAFNIKSILDWIDWHYLLLIGVFAAFILLPDAAEEEVDEPVWPSPQSKEID